MTTSHGSLTLESAKAQAKSLRAQLAADGMEITHAKALEMVAAQHGARDWNTLHARLVALPNRIEFHYGQEVKGEYLGQPFSGVLVSVSGMSGGLTRVTIRFDEAVDVVTFDSFSNFRKQVNAIVDEGGISPRSTSNGKPQLVLRPA